MFDIYDIHAYFQINYRSIRKPIMVSPVILYAYSNVLFNS